MKILGKINNVIWRVRVKIEDVLGELISAVGGKDVR
jgi:hypothetical protein